MPYYRKKPIVIEATQWFPDREHPGVMRNQRPDANGHTGTYVITIHEQRAYIEPGDWILPEPKPGRFYPCKPDIFAATYELAGAVGVVAAVMSDEWMQNPYTKVLMKSMDEDYVPRSDFERANRERHELLAELMNIAKAKRFNRKHFDDDHGFADWAQSRARYAIDGYGADDE